MAVQPPPPPPQPPPPPTPEARRATGTLLAGGVILVVFGSLISLFFIPGVAFAIGSGEEPSTVAGFVLLALFGAVQIWAGIVAIQGRRTGRLMGMVVAGVGTGAGAVGLVAAAIWVRDEPSSLYTAIALTAVILAVSGSAFVLLWRGRPVR